MRNSKRFISVLLCALMLITTVTVTSVAASTETLCSKYATNPGGKVGVQKTITVDGSASDWSEDMMIAQGAAWDVANNYKGGHENCVLDTYALFACWDNDNLYVAWQMVNTTDTWAREGDGPLSDGGRVLDVPLILALSVDPTRTSMSNKNTNGGSIWGQKMGVKFDVHVDHLFYMSGKPGLGEPSMFTAADAQGNTNYTDHCLAFAKGGIQYKMAETNICSQIWGLDGSKSTKDIYSDSANWVDYKTKKHSTKYDSFYEMKIPFSALGINASYLKNNGIGAMLVATRGESGLDCIPYDDCMLDNATGSYSNDPSTSKEKEDEDVITSALARIGKSSGGTVVNPTNPTDPTDPTVATDPVTSTDLTVNGSSNLFGSASYKANKGDTITVKYDMTSAMKVCNAQWMMSYDASKLRLKSTGTEMAPVTGGIVNTESGKIYGNFSEVNKLADFTNTGTLAQATFEVIGTGTGSVNLDVQELSVGYLSGGKLVYQNAVKNSTRQNINSVSGFSSNSISGSAKINSGSAGNVKWGDVDLNGKVTIMDATMIQRFLVNDPSANLNETQKKAADTDGNGKVTIMDATYIQRYLAGM